MNRDVISNLLQRDIILLISEIVIGLSVIGLFFAIIVDFAFFQEKSNVSKEKKSIVETGTMTLFFIMFTVILKITRNITPNLNIEMKRNVALTGAILVLIGVVINVVGRFNLGENWANHIKIYSNHKLINTGVYKIVRHPLYSSIMLMFIGASVAYFNIYCLLLESIIFIPFMYYRAKQEEKLLTEKFPEYLDYKKGTGMFFPKIIRGSKEK